MKAKMSKRKINEENTPKEIIELAHKIRKKRFDQEMTQEQLAERANLSVNHLGSIERGEHNPSFLSLIQLARALNLSPKEFMPEK